MQRWLITTESGFGALIISSVYDSADIRVTVTFLLAHHRQGVRGVLVLRSERQHQRQAGHQGNSSASQAQAVFRRVPISCPGTISGDQSAVCVSPHSLQMHVYL